jgi:hypothetical protein
MLLGKDRKYRGASWHLGGWIGHFKRFCDLLDQDEVSKRGKYKIERGKGSLVLPSRSSHTNA